MNTCQRNRSNRNDVVTTNQHRWNGIRTIATRLTEYVGKRDDYHPPGGGGGEGGGRRGLAVAAFAALTLGCLSNSSLGDLDHYEPYVLVDIGEMIDAEEEMTVTLGEARDVNDLGYVVGWYEDDYGQEQPFVLDPADGGSLMDIDLDRFELAWMEAINSPSSDDLDDVVIAGWAIDAATQGPGETREPVRWTWDSGSSIWELDTIYSNGARGVANDVSDTGFITGFFMNGSDKHVFYGTGVSNPADWGPGEGFGIYASAVVCGDAENPDESYQLQGFAQWGSDPDDDRQYLVGADPMDEYSHARGINDDGDIVGSAAQVTSTYKVWVWHYQGGTSWDTGEQLTPLPQLYYRAVANDINDEGEIVGNYEHPLDIDGFYTLEYDDTWKSINLHGNTLFPLTHLELLLEDTPNPKVDRCYGINNNAWVAGSFQPDKDADPESYRPCLMVQNDMDNDSAPDQRELFTAEESDSNTNKLIDSAEEIRDGLFAPGAVGVYSGSGLLDDVYVARFMGFHQKAVECIVDDQAPNCGDTCYNLSTLVNGWANDSDGKEVIVNVRTIDPESEEDDYNRDCLAANTDHTEDEILENLRTFSYRFAQCIDGVQLGNEIFSGPGQYQFYEGDLPVSEYEGLLGDIDSLTTLEEALDAVFNQLGLQIDAARRGSALAGRPLRIFGPAVSAKMTLLAKDGEIISVLTDEEDRFASAIDMLIDFADEERAIFDQHLNYETYSEFGDVTDAITGVGSPPWGDGPAQIASLEFGPIPEKDNYWPSVSQDAAKYFKGADPDPDPCYPADDQWFDDMVEPWRAETVGNNGLGGDADYYIDDVLDDLETLGFRYACINTRQKGLVDGEATKNDMGTLRGDEVRDDCIDRAYLLMPIADSYEDYATGPDPFDPHPDTAECGCIE